MNFLIKYLFLIGVSNIFSLIGHAQINSVDSQKVKKMFDEIEKFPIANPISILLKWDSIALYCEKINWKERTVAANGNAALHSTTLNRPDICYQYVQKFEKSFESNKHLLGSHYEEHAQNLMISKAFYFYLLGDHKNALSLFKTHLDNSIRLTTNFDFNLIMHFNNVAAAELKVGNIQNAIDNYSNAFKIQLQYPSMFRSILQLNTNLGELYTKTNSFDQASLHYQKALIAKDSIEKLTKKGENLTKSFILLYNSIADLYTKNKLYDKAIENLNFSLKYQNSKNALWGSTMKKMSDIYIEANRLDKAELYLQDALSAAQKKYSRHYELAQIYISFAHLADKKKDYTTALRYTQQALIALSEKFNNPDISNTPSVSEVFSKRDLLEVLDLKAGLLFKTAEKQPTYLDIAYKTVQSAEALIDIIRADCTSDFDKQYLSDLCYPVYEKSVRIAYQLYARDKTDNYMESVYNSIEKNKAIVLLEALKNTQAETELNDTDRNRLYQLRSEIAKLEENIYREKNEKRKTLNDSTVIAYQSRLTVVKQGFEVLTKKMESQYPNYFKLKFGKLTREMSEVQKALTPTDLLLNYFMTEDAIYIVALTTVDKQLIKMPKSADFDKILAALRQFIANRSSDDAHTFASLSYMLYQNLLAYPLSISKSKHLIIIPDGLLDYIPFDIFITSNKETNPSFLNLPYLLRDYNCSYAYSAASYWEQKNFKKGRGKKLFAGFAPTYNYDNTSIKKSIALTTPSNPLHNLPGALREVTYASTLFKGDAFTDNTATEKIFRDKAQDYRILHFGMHSLLNDKSPLLSNLVFTHLKNDSTTDNKLTINELYGLRLNADLAVLSACNTGMGDINRGEGVISLSRAFAYTGVPATIMSLWEVEDFSTSDIIPLLYDNLKAGQNKDEALKNAKITYLSIIKTDAEAHPYYWAGLIATGNTDALDLNTSLSIFPILGGLSIFLFTLLFYKLKSKKQTP